MLAKVLALLLSPLAWLIRQITDHGRATQDRIKRFYKSPELKQLRYAQLAKSPTCLLCGRSAKDSARMNVNHIRPLHSQWRLRLAP